MAHWVRSLRGERLRKSRPRADSTARTMSQAAVERRLGDWERAVDHDAQSSYARARHHAYYVGAVLEEGVAALPPRPFTPMLGTDFGDLPATPGRSGTPLWMRSVRRQRPQTAPHGGRAARERICRPASAPQHGAAPASSPHSRLWADSDSDEGEPIPESPQVAARQLPASRRRSVRVSMSRGTDELHELLVSGGEAFHGDDLPLVTRCIDEGVFAAPQTGRKRAPPATSAAASTKAGRLCATACGSVAAISYSPRRHRSVDPGPHKATRRRRRCVILCELQCKRATARKGPVYTSGVAARCAGAREGLSSEQFKQSQDRVRMLSEGLDPATVVRCLHEVVPASALIRRRSSTIDPDIVPVGHSGRPAEPTPREEAQEPVPEEEKRASAVGPDALPPDLEQCLEKGHRHVLQRGPTLRLSARVAAPKRSPLRSVQLEEMECVPRWLLEYDVLAPEPSSFAPLEYTSALGATIRSVMRNLPSLPDCAALHSRPRVSALAAPAPLPFAAVLWWAGDGACAVEQPLPGAKHLYHRRSFLFGDVTSGAKEGSARRRHRA